MDDASEIDRQKVGAEFDKRAREFQNENAVLDANVTEIRKNILRNYLTKKILLKYLKPHHDDVIIDYGCGVGRLSRMLSKKVKQIEAFDRSSEMIRVANAMTDSKDSSSIHYHFLRNDKLPLPNESVTKFFSFWVLQHVDDEELKNILSEASRILKQSGLVYLFEQVSEQSKVLGKIHHIRTAEQYIEAARSAGLTIVSNERVLRFPSYAMHIWENYSWLTKSFMPALSMIESLTVNRKPEAIEYSTNAMIFRKAD